jgi:ParB-like chromosome segregation protein Spo0J
MTQFDSNIAIEAPSAALKHISSKGLSTNVRVPLDKLKPLPGFNVRTKGDDYQAAVREFANSIRENGFYDHKPLAVIVLPGDDTLYIYDGETRYDALQLLLGEGVTVAEVPVALAPAGTTVEDLTVAMAQSNDGRQLTPLALADLVKRLQGYGWDKDKIATKIGKTTRYLDNLLVLAGAPKAVREAVAADKIAAAEAVKIVRKDPKTAAKVVGDKVKAAEAAGKKKATPKRAATGPKMKAIRHTFAVPEGDKMGDVLKALAKRIREEFGIDANDVLEETGSLDIVIHVIDHEAEAAAAEKAKKAAEADAAKKAAAKAPAKAPEKKGAETGEKPKRTRKAPAKVETPEGGKTPEAAQEAPQSPEAGAGDEETGDQGGDVVLDALAAQQAKDGESAGDDGMGGL